MVCVIEAKTVITRSLNSRNLVIADKCLRYHHHFKKMIVVLFNIRTKTQRFYDEWEDGLKKYFPDVVVIKK